MENILPTIAELDAHPSEHKMTPLQKELNVSKPTKMEGNMSISDGDDDEFNPPNPTSTKTLF